MESSGLDGNYPNPFNSTTNIRYRVSEISQVKLQIYDMLGREVRTLVDEFLPAGEYSAHWTGINNYGEQVSSGLYLYRITTGDQAVIRKMTLMK